MTKQYAYPNTWVSMKSVSIFFLIFLLARVTPAQTTSIELNTYWQFYHPENKKWYKATVPGTIHTDLLDNKLIPDPYDRDNEAKLQWIGERDWEYRTSFDVDAATFAKQHIVLQFDGLDTYADVYLNGTCILQADNMFRGWGIQVKKLLRRTKNLLSIHFYSAQRKADSLARAMLPLVLPDNNRVFVRKAQYHFGWDWGPKFVTCGIWKKIKLESWNGPRFWVYYRGNTNTVRLVQNKDTSGTSFYFEKDGTPIYCKGANWIPGDMFLPRLTKADYRRMLQSAKDANMNMLRVWGGGIYEDDAFYDLCDSLGIMVWQDLMFAGGMVPGDEHFFNNVHEEIKYQLNRLGHHPCIVLWCGNNEVDEAWHNWGWQQDFKLHGIDSARVWHNYERMFKDSIPKWIHENDGNRPYISTSPMHGWGHAESMTEGDSHYWGLWWGLEDWEIFKTRTGRFISEYGMQSMPNWNTCTSFTLPGDRILNSPIIQAHQKAVNGFNKIDHYLTRYFTDASTLSKLTLEEYSYLTQCMQYYILKNAIAVQRSQYPRNMGTLLWQLNDCWPVASWSITDYSRQPKAAWYAVKEAYRNDVLPAADTVYPKDLKLEKPIFTMELTNNILTIKSSKDAKYVCVSRNDNTSFCSDNYFDMKAGEIKTVFIQKGVKIRNHASDLKIKSLYDVLKAK